MRVVSLVPSLSEAIHASAPGALVGVTDWCPADIPGERLRGTKNPSVDRVVALSPDLVVVNTEENRAPDLDALRDAGLRLHVTDMETVPAALEQLAGLMDLLEVVTPPWLEAAQESWAAPIPLVTARAVIPIWRRPWMHLGRDTFAGDVLRRLGVDNVLGGHAERYPAVPVEDLPPHDLVVLPDEPYEFTAGDGPEAFAGVRSALVSGRHLTWYGPSLAEAREVLTGQLGLS